MSRGRLKQSMTAWDNNELLSSAPVRPAPDKSATRLMPVDYFFLKTDVILMLSGHRHVLTFT